MSVTFKLRPEAKFSDGSALTSADVAWSEGIWAEGPNFGAVYAGIRKVRTPDDRTVVFELYDPDTTLPVVLSWSASGVMPEDFGGRTEDEYYEQPIGAGAFTVEELSDSSASPDVAASLVTGLVGVGLIAPAIPGRGPWGRPIARA